MRITHQLMKINRLTAGLMKMSIGVGVWSTKRNGGLAPSVLPLIRLSGTFSP
jgi:hypothetical protein